MYVIVQGINDEISYMIVELALCSKPEREVSPTLSMKLRGNFFLHFYIAQGGMMSPVFDSVVGAKSVFWIR
jgi:hypothetical protein